MRVGSEWRGKKISKSSMKVLRPKIYATHERISLISAENGENKQNEKEECKLLETSLRHGMTETLEKMTCEKKIIICWFNLKPHKV